MSHDEAALQMDTVLSSHAGEQAQNGISRHFWKADAGRIAALRCEMLKEFSGKS
jgi:hypothetical protein